MFVQRAALAFVGIDMLIDPLMANRHQALEPHHAMDLLGAPVLTQTRFDEPPMGSGNSLATDNGTALLEEPVSLFGAISTIASVATQLAADRGLVKSQGPRNGRLALARFQSGVNLYTVVFRKAAPLMVCRGKPLPGSG